MVAYMDVLNLRRRVVYSVTARTKVSPLFLPVVKYVSSMVAAYSILEPAGNIYEKLGLCFVREGEILLSDFCP